jgi:exodeoxyribonuclease VIII
MGKTGKSYRRAKLMQTPEPGLHYNVPFETYAAWDAVNNSVLKLMIDKTPAHARHYMLEGRKETPALLFGRAADCYLLEPTRFHMDFAVGPECDKRTREGKALWADFLETVRPGQEIISQSDYDAIQKIYGVVSASQAMRLIEGGLSQVCCVWKDEPTGLLCKARFDYLQPDIPMITDLKTSQSADPERFAVDIFKYGYYQQAGFYTMGYRAVTGFDMDPPFCIFAIEKEAPYVHNGFELHADTVSAGQIAARRALTLYAKCLAEDKWPAYTDKITILNMPYWALRQTGWGQ